MTVNLAVWTLTLASTSDICRMLKCQRVESLLGFFLL